MFDVPTDNQYVIPDQEGVFLVPETTIIQRPGVTWAFSRADDRRVYERASLPIMQRATVVREFERASERLEFQGGTP